MACSILRFTPFDVSYREVEREQGITRANHGRLWTPGELHRLKGLFLCGYDLKNLCELLQRPGNGIVPKLVGLKLIQQAGDGSYFTDAYANPEPQPQENTMNPDAYKGCPEAAGSSRTAPTIESKTFIAGRDAANMTDQEIFQFIGKKEREIEVMENIKNKPKKLQALIDATNDDIAKLVAYVDGREAS